MDIEKLKNELRRDEGLRLIPYRCTAGHWTIGYGHNLEAAGFPDASIQYFFEAPIRIKQADTWLLDDIEDAVACAKDWLGSEAFDSLADARQRVVVNMAFNLGRRLLGFGRLRRAILSGDWMEAAKEMLDSRWARQVGARAVRLAEMMREG